MQPQVTLFVPGRLCLFGEHSDWAGVYRLWNADIVPGHALVTGIDQGITATARPSDGFSIDYLCPCADAQPFFCPMDPALLTAEAQKGGYDSYVAGVAAFMAENYPVGGVGITITKRDLPVKKGLSSSAAICVLVAQAFDRLYGLGLTQQDIMHAAYMGEQRTPSRCGRLDQVCAYGRTCVEMHFDGSTIACTPLQPARPLYLVFADLCREKDTVAILSGLGSAYPFPRTEQEKQLHLCLGADNHQLVSEAVEALKDGDAPRLGALMTQAQALFDEKAQPLCPAELTAPALHQILADPVVQSLSYGGKGVGSQGDGSVQFVARDPQAQAALCARLTALGCSPYSLTLSPRKPVTRAILPVAGYGTRMYPATRFVRKELLPVFTPDGEVQPALLSLLTELQACGIQKVCLVVSPGAAEEYARLLAPVSMEHFAHLSEKQRQQEQRLQELLSQVELVEQTAPMGFGDAVYRAQAFTQGEPTLLLLGDTLYQSHTDISCTQQLLSLYARHGLTTVGIGPIAAEDSRHYGVLTGVWEDQEEESLLCTAMAEKPSAALAQEQYATRTRSGPAIFGVFGQYVLTKEVFSRLEHAVTHRLVSARGEIELTDALAALAQEGILRGARIQGTSLDIGNPAAYRKTLLATLSSASNSDKVGI